MSRKFESDLYSLAAQRIKRQERGLPNQIGQIELLNREFLAVTQLMRPQSL